MTGLTASAQPKRSLVVKARWAGREISLVSSDGGKTYLASTGEEGVILSIENVQGKFVARLEHRPRGNAWAGDVRRSIDVALASLQHEVRRISRAGNVRGGA